MADDEISAFLNSILSIKTKPTPEGIGSNIIGTLRSVDQVKGTITLDDVVQNGEEQPNGFVLSTAAIGDLFICGKAPPPPVLSPLKPETAKSTATHQIKDGIRHSKSLKENVPKEAPLSTGAGRANSAAQISKPLHSQLKSLANIEKEPKRQLNNEAVVLDLAPVLTQSKPNINSSKTTDISLAGSALMNMFTESMKQQQNANSNNDKTDDFLGTDKRDDPKLVYKASDIEQTYFTNARKPQTKTFQQILQHQNQSIKQREEQHNLSFTPRTVSRRDQGGSVVTQPALSKGTSSQKNLGHSNGSSSSVTKKGVYGNPRTQQIITSEGQKSNPFFNLVGAKFQGKDQNFIQNQHLERFLKSKQNSTPNNGKIPPPKDATTFEMTNDEIRANEFDFEKNLNMFEKLPVTSKRPTKVQHNPHFTSADTTFKVARTIESIKLRGIPSEKSFLTATGITIPSVGENTRKSILDLAHNLGITYIRTIESMGRSVAQVCIPLLGDSFRFSPEREDDRPKVLFCASPDWQGASCLCAARFLASQGVHTFVYSTKEEVSLCSTEEQLYRLSSQPFTRDLNTFIGLKFDLVVLAIGDQLKDENQVKKYREFVRDKPIVLIDPPLLESFQKTLIDRNGNKDKDSSRMFIVTPTLPLPYTTDSGLKVFLVNLGIPHRIFEENNVSYRSPFGDKLVVQIFSAPTSQQPQ